MSQELRIFLIKKTAQSPSKIKRHSHDDKNFQITEIKFYICYLMVTII